MSRVQFYPDKDLLKALDKDARRYGVTMSMLVNDLLKRHYGLVPETSLSETELNSIIFQEIKGFIESKKTGEEFDLLRASKTFSEIEMTYSGRPSTIRAKIGKNFAKAVGHHPDFKEVEVVKINDKIKRNLNNAAIYRIK